jgi:hypothetical protein
VYRKPILYQVQLALCQCLERCACLTLRAEVRRCVGGGGAAEGGPGVAGADGQGGGGEGCDSGEGDGSGGGEEDSGEGDIVET